MDFDYLIIGAGSAGCVLANRLSADPSVRVCVLDAGPRDVYPFIHIPGAFGLFMFSRKYNWAYDAKSDPALRQGSPLFCPRGKALGGSSSTNGMIYIRGHRWDFDHWAALGNEGWSFADVLPYFRKSEANERGASTYHGADGELHVSDWEKAYPISQVFLDAAREAGLPTTDDFNGDRQEGIGPYQFTIKDGRRWSTATAFLRPATSRANLKIITGAHVQRIEFDDKRATGVTFQWRRRAQTLRATREVILAGGTYNSPQILMLSGIGEPPELAAHGIATVHALPGVGKNLQEHPDTCAAFTSVPHDGLRFTPAGIVQLATEGIKYFAANKGKMRTTISEVGGFLRSRPDVEIPDIQLHALPLLFDDSGRDLGLMAQDGISCHVCVLRPKARGTVSLATRPGRRPGDRPSLLHRSGRYAEVGRRHTHRAQDPRGAGLCALPQERAVPGRRQALG